MRVSYRTWSVINPNIGTAEGERLSSHLPKYTNYVVNQPKLNEDGIGFACGSCNVFHLYDEYPNDDTCCPSCGFPYDGSTEEITNVSGTVPDQS